MKKRLFSFVLCFVLSSAAIAQVSFGLKAGGMLSNTHVSVVDTLSDLSDAKLSYLVGGFLNIPISNKFSVQPELLYANKGSENFYQHYVNLPIMFQYEVIDKLKVEVGPELGYLLGAYSYSDFNNGNNRRFDIIDLDLGINIGVSYDVLDKLNVGLRYNMGIIDTHEFQTSRFGFGSPNELPDFNVQNRTLQLSVGWKFGK